MKSTRLATWCVALGVASFLSLNARAAVYSDPSNDLFDNGLANLDITGVEVTNDGVNLVIAVTTRGFATWTKYLIWIDTPAKANAAANSNGWGRPASMATGEGADFFIGSWVDATPGNAQLWEFASAWNQHSSSPLTNLISGNTVTFTIPLSTLGLSAGNVIKFDVATSGGGNDPGVDHVSRSTTATTGWAAPSTGGSMLSYTIAALADSDSDGLADTWENTYFGNLDQTGSGDPDSDGLNNSGELTAGTNPTVADTDGDGLNDGAEVNTHTTNPLVADTDGDGVNDGAEVAAGTNPKKTNYSTITVAGSFQGWSPTPTNNPSNVMTKVTGEEFGWELNFRMSSATNYVGKFVNGTAFGASNNVNWGTSATPGTASLGGYGNDIPFNVTATGVYRFYFNTDTLAYTFARVAAPATYAAWAAQYGLAAGSGADDADSDSLTNDAEFTANSDPLNNDTDGDGLPDYFEVIGFNDFSIVTSPITPDTDGDVLRDAWELQYGLDPTDNGSKLDYVNNTGLTVSANPNGASADPDGDGLTNLQEQTAGTNPLAAGTGFASAYPKITVPGSFNGFNAGGNAANTMQLVGNFSWKLIVYFATAPTGSPEYKFAAGSWDTNWGPSATPGVAAPGGMNISASAILTAAGYYVFTFNDSTLAYTLAPLAATDGDSDGLPDEWEVYYGGLLSPKLTNLVPTTAYVAGSSTTAAEAYAAGTDPVRDTTPPTIALAAGVAKLVQIPLAGTLPSITAADVVAADNIGTPTVTIGYSVNGNGVPSIPVDEAAIAVITYTATDGSANTATVQRTLVVGDAAPNYRKLHYPHVASISTIGSTAVYGRIFVEGATAGAGQAPNITAELGVNSANTDPAGWTGTGVWGPATYNSGFTDGDDEYQATINGADLTAGTYYYAYRFKLGDGAWHYAGINEAGTDGGPWDATNGNGTLTVTEAIARQVTYAVDMGVQIFRGSFDPATNGVEVRANFNNYAGGVSLLSREGTSTIYSGTFAVEGAESSTNNYKFFSTGTNAVGYEAGSDRQAILTANGVPMNTGTNFFSGVSESRKITFRVDMSVQAAKGNFNTNSGVVQIAGSFNGWSTTATPLSAQGNGVYAAEVTVDGPVSGIAYKFLKGTAEADYEQVSDRTIAAVLPNLQSSTLDVALFGNDDGVAPTDIALSASSIAENNAVNAVVGALSSTDATAGDTHTYSLVAGAGDTDNGSFNISGADLRAGAAFDFETKASYSVRVRSTDAKGNFFEKAFSITVSDVTEGTTFAGWSGGAELNSANVGKYAIGGASSPTATDGVKPTSTVSGGNLVLTAIVRVDDAKVSVVGEAVTSLAEYGTPASITSVTGSAAGIDQTGVPAGCEKQAFTVAQGADTRKFLRLKATLAP
jgi:hypothetical protein